MPEKNLCIPLLGAGRSKKGLDGKSPCVMVLLANISPKERIGEKVGDPSSPLPPCPFPMISRGEESKLWRGRDTQFSSSLEKKGSRACSFLAHQAFLRLDSSSPDPASGPLTLLPSPRKTPQLQMQVKQIFVAASKFQRLFIARLSAPGAKSCC